MKDKDIALVEALKELCNSRYKCDNGTFKLSYTIILEKAMKISCPRSNIKVVPHIKSKGKKNVTSLLSCLAKVGSDGMDHKSVWKYARITYENHTYR